MSTNADDLIISISTDLAAMRRSLRRLESDVDQSTRRTSRRFDDMGSRINSSLGKIGAGFAAALSLKAAGQLADAATNIANALKVAGLEGKALTSVYETLLASANKNAAPVESLVGLYSKLSLAAKELGVDQGQLLTFTDRIALALRVGGTSAEAASGALLQLSQAIGGGVVRAEEFNSQLEATPTIVQAVAAGLSEAGGSVAKLRALVNDGRISSKLYFDAFLAGSVVLEAKLAGSVMTTSQRFVQLQNVLIDTAGKVDKVTGASGAFGESLEDLGVTVQQFGEIVIKASDSELGTFVGWLSEGVNKASELKKIMGGLPGIFEKLSSLNKDIFRGKPLGTGLKEGAIDDRIDRAFEGLPDKPVASPKVGRLPALPPAQEVKTVSIKDYPIDGAEKEPKTKTAKEPKPPSDYERELATLKERTVSLNAAYAATAALNPLSKTYAQELEKAAAAQELLTAAMRDGKEVTPELKAEIDAQADAYARASAAAEKIAEQHEAARESAKEMADEISGAFMGVLQGLQDGKSIGKAIADAAIGGVITMELKGFFE